MAGALASNSGVSWLSVVRGRLRRTLGWGMLWRICKWPRVVSCARASRAVFDALLRRGGFNHADALQV